MIFENTAEFIKFAISNKYMPLGTLRFYGDWFGRPYDNCHVAKELTYFNDILSIKFADTYEIKICNPKMIEVQVKSFLVHKADCVTFEYGMYGNPNEKKIRFIRYVDDGEYIQKYQGIIAESERLTRKLEKVHNAFEILSY